MTDPVAEPAMLEPPIKIENRKRPIRKIGWAILVLLIALGAIFTFYRLRGPTAEERAAFALMHKDYRPTHGVNAFPLLFYIGYDVPEDRLDAQMAADVEKIRQSLAASGPSAVQFIGTDAPLLPLLSPKEVTILCSVIGKGCLTQVAAHADTVRAALALHSAIAVRAQAFERTDYYWDEFPADNRTRTSWIEFNHIAGAQKLWLNAFALQYIQGDRIGALAATCRNLAAWRRVARGSNSLVSILNSNIWIDGMIRLFSDMLAGLPADETVPKDCALALQPVVAADVDRCAVSARQTAIIESTSEHNHILNDKGSWDLHIFGFVILNQHLNLVWMTQLLADSCGNNAIIRFLADELPHRQQVRSFFGVPATKGLACIANIAGCILVARQTPLLENFDTNTLDRAAHLRLAATLLWLRENPGGSIEERFNRRPAYLRSPHHASWYDAKEGMIYVDTFDQSPDITKRFGLPVAAAH